MDFNLRASFNLGPVVLDVVSVRVLVPLSVPLEPIAVVPFHPLAYASADQVEIAPRLRERSPRCEQEDD
jgi:hypothetical protein